MISAVRRLGQLALRIAIARDRRSQRTRSALLLLDEIFGPRRRPSKLRAGHAANLTDRSPVIRNPPSFGRADSTGSSTHYDVEQRISRVVRKPAMPRSAVRAPTVGPDDIYRSTGVPTRFTDRYQRDGSPASGSP